MSEFGSSGAEARSHRPSLRDVVDGILTPFVLLEAVRGPDGAIIDFVYTEANSAACQYNDLRYEDLVGARLLELLPGHEGSGLLARYEQVVRTGTPLILNDFVYEQELLGGEPRRYDIRAVKIGDGLSYSWADVTERNRLAADLAHREERFRLLAENATDVVYETDLDGRIVWISPGVLETLGWHPEDLVGTPSADLLHPDDVDQLLPVRDQIRSGPDVSLTPVRCRTRSGSFRVMSVRARGVVDAEGAATGLVVGMRDITDERTAQDQLSFLAFHDSLTGLRNRSWMLDILASDLAAARRDGVQVALLFLDLDEFKLVNDSLGHAAGDEILVATARRIAPVLRPGDRIGRFGGDEFLVIAPGIHQRYEVEAIAERLCASVTDEVQVEGRSVVLSASIGIAVSDPTSTPTSLLRDADSALFRAKAAGRARWEFADPDMHTQAMSRLDTEADLRAAIADRQFVVHYQPIVSLADETVVGHEALVRWEHPVRGAIPPGVFLPIAELSGLIVDIDEQVLDQVCRMLSSRPDIEGPVSVNKSPLQFRRLDWALRFIDCLNLYGIDPHRVVIEVTETAVMSVLERTKQDFAHLRSLGVGIHIDDFGTGYSSISLLRDLPVTGLKLDLSFTRLITTDNYARALAAGLAQLAHGLELECTAEGIETPEQAAILRQQGWTHGQGYLYGRPEPRS